MPTHSTEHNASDPAVIEANKEGSITSKMKTLFRRSSAAAPAHADASKAHASSRDPDTVDAVLDQSSRGEQLPSAEANKMGATNVNANAEMGWPGMVGGDKLGAVVISLQAVEKGKVSLGGGKKGEGSWVTVPVSQATLCGYCRVFRTVLK